MKYWTTMQLVVQSFVLLFFSKATYQQTSYHQQAFGQNLPANSHQLKKEEAEQYQSFDILAPNVIVPEKETTYWCSVHKLPDFVNSVHGVGFESFILKSSNDIIHHIEVFGCDLNDREIAYFSGECRSPNIPKELSRCRRVLAAWASGAETLWYPEEAGLTFFSSSKSQFVRLEIHYNNQERKMGIRDSSGIRFFYTNQRRIHDVGILEIGVIDSPDMIIPPNQNSFTWLGVCPAMCTKQALPHDGINIFATQLHAHLTGRKLWISHKRGNKTLREVNRDDNYSTWIEKIVPEKPMTKFLPGDRLTLSCEFNTNGNPNVTNGGLGIHEEMCVSFVHYYPDCDLEVCKSSISQNAFRGYLSLLSTIQSGASSPLQYGSINWSPSAVRLLQLLYQHAPMKIDCIKSTGDLWPGNWENFSGYLLNN